MSLLARYVLSEVLQLFLVSVVALTFMLLVFGMGKEAFSHGLGIAPILRLLPYILPTALLFAVPATLLFAVTNVCGRMSSGGEIIALKSLGISPRAVLLPIYVLAVLLSLLTYWLNDVAFSWGDSGVKRVVIDAVEEIAYSVLRTQRSYSSPQFSVNVKRVEGRKLISPVFTFGAAGQSPGGTIIAEDAELKSNPGSGVLTITCHNVTTEVGGTSWGFSDSVQREIRLIDPKQDPHDSESPSHLPLSVLPELTTKQLTIIERFEQELAADTAYSLATGDFAHLGGAQAEIEAQRVKSARQRLYRMQTEPPRRWANGFSCLCFVMVGAPMAILRRYSDSWATFFVCFLPILVVYYPLMMYAVDRSKNGALLPIIVWLGNAVLAAWGIWLLRRVYRY